MAMPALLVRTKMISKTISMIDNATIARSIARTNSGPIATSWFSQDGAKKVRGWAEIVITARFSRTIATAREAINPVTCGAPRMGRNAIRSMSIPNAAPVATTIGTAARNGRCSTETQASVVKAPMAKMSPWAKLISRTMP